DRFLNLAFAATKSSCPALCRASTSLELQEVEDVDGRDEPGHDGISEQEGGGGGGEEASPFRNPVDLGKLLRAQRPVDRFDVLLDLLDARGAGDHAGDLRPRRQP